MPIVPSSAQGVRRISSDVTGSKNACEVGYSRLICKNISRIVQPAALAAIGGGPVVIEGPRPEGRQGQMFRERSGDADPGHVGIEDL